MKKTKSIIKLSIVGIVWTYLYVNYASLFIFKTWNFDVLSTDHWRIISSIWDKGGTISTLKDYMFVLSLIMFIPLWLIGLRFFYKLNYLNVLLFPIFLYNQRIIKKYGENAPRIKLKNIGTQKKIDINELIDQRLEKTGPVSKTDVSDIRQAIQKKIDKAKK